jgi:DNA-directed RNA polymerase subunit beta
LDESGIIKLGAEVNHGDLLVGKITPKGETQLSPEEKLLRAIFGEKAGDVKDTSLRVPPGVHGIVIDAKIFSRRGTSKDARTRQIEAEELKRLKKNIDDEIRIIDEVFHKKLEDLLVGHKCSASLIKKKNKKILIPQDTQIDMDSLVGISVADIEGIVLEDAQLTEKIHDIQTQYRTQCADRQKILEDRISQYEKGDDLPPGIIKMVKVYVAMKRKLSVGDKMAGRHGNKGVVSRILPQEDLPYFEDGTPVDMILNPLGVPSRMNVGQILEIHIGYAAKGLGNQLNSLIKAGKHEELRKKLKRIFSDLPTKTMLDKMEQDSLLEFVGKYKDGVHMTTPVFDGAKESEIKELLKEANLNTTGQTTLYDGRTGEPFKEKITVGTMYMLKLHHLVDDKIHARSIGPYSLVTQQPLGGKAQFGGQRLGEMEGWAMEAYGAAYSLQEFLTVKSDDMAGRTRMYEKIVKGQTSLEPGLPESFNVLNKELQGLGLDITLMEEE